MIHGNAIVGQSGGPTAAINATLAGVISGMLKQKKSTLYGMRNGIDGVLCDHLINLSETFTDENGSIREDDLALLAHTPAAALGSCRHKLPAADDLAGEQTYEKIIEIFKKYDIRTFFYIGGNDSMDTVAKLSFYTEKVGYPMTLIGVPKTIDNDLMGTDHTPGFGSAAKFVATVTREIIFDCAVYTVPAVTIVEIMGRDAGWLTAAAAIGRVVDGIAPDYVYLPERDFSMEGFMDDLRAALAKHPNVVVAISEGIHLADGTPVGAASGVGPDAFGHVQLGGAGKALEYAVREQIGCKVRSIELNLPQRCGAHLLSATDIEESLRTGEGAVMAAAQGVSGEMMTIDRVSNAPYRTEIGHKPVAAIANQVRYVDAAYINEAGNNITDAGCHYLAPVIEGKISLPYAGGVPKFYRFD
ncbi:MAG: 6-phosphofructokinase [Clostridia bacterium]|nr:6-phosphofructokinase [Clostridia bacterium]